MTYIRSEKTTPNEDAFKTLLVGSILAIVVLLGMPQLSRGLDLYFLDRPVVRASTLEIHRGIDGEGIYIAYDADAAKPVTAIWIASMYDAEGSRLASRRGEGAYNDAVDSAKFWTWDAWFDQEDGTPPPFVPDRPFKLCVRYIAVTLDTRITDDSGQFCSPIFDPAHSK